MANFTNKFLGLKNKCVWLQLVHLWEEKEMLKPLSFLIFYHEKVLSGIMS